MIAGLIIIAVGAVLLLNQLGIFPHGIVVHFWPVALIVVGLIKIFNGKERGEWLAGGCLIVGGVLLQTNSLGITHITLSQAWPMFIIVVGLMMVAHSLSGKACGGPASTTDADLDSFYIFGGGERNVNAKDFRSARLFAVFGGYEVDLSRAEMAGNEAYVEANAVFGGGVSGGGGGSVGVFDGVVDFAPSVADKTDPTTFDTGFNRNDKLRCSGKRGFAEWAGKGLILVGKVSIMIGMGMIESFKLGAVSFSLVNHELQLFIIHRVGDGRGARVGLRVEGVQLILDIFQAVDSINVAIGQDHTATLFRKSFLGMLANLFQSFLRQE